MGDETTNEIRAGSLQMLSKPSCEYLYASNRMVFIRTIRNEPKEKKERESESENKAVEDEEYHLAIKSSLKERKKEWT